MKTQKAGTILVDVKNKKIGLVYRDALDDYSFPKGHLEAWETLPQCAVRETEEETGRVNHLVSEKEICIMEYTTPRGEEVECYYYIAIDDAQTEKTFEEHEVENLVWVDFEEVREKLSYDNLKELWDNAIEEVMKLF